MSEIILSNSMSAEYNLMSMNESYIQLDVIIGNYYENDIEIAFEVRELVSSNIKLDYEVTYGEESFITIEYLPVMTSFIGIEYEVNPHNLMKVAYELQKPPTIKLTSFPIQDSFVASRNPYAIVNYGRNNSMMVGQDHKGENIGYVKFDTSIIPQGVIIKSAKARLYYSQMAQNQTIEVYRVKGDWSEYGITYRNLPPIDEFLTDKYVNNEEEFYIEFDLTDLASQWTDGLQNFGLSLRSTSGISVLRTREYPQAPELIVEYYSPTPAVYTSSRIFTEFEVAALSSKSIAIEYDVHSDFRFTDIQLDYFVKAPNDVFDEFIEIEYEVNEKPYLDAESIIGINYEISDESFDFIETEFEVPYYESDTEISIEFDVRVEEDSSIDLEFEVNEYESDSEVEIEYVIPYDSQSVIVIEFFAEGYNTYHNSINIEFDITSVDSSDIELEYEVAEYTDDSTIEIEYTIPFHDVSDIDLEFEVNEYEDVSEINIEFFIASHGDSTIGFEFEVPYYEENSSIELEFTVVEFADSDIHIEFDVVVETISEIEFEFGVWGYGDNSISIEYLPRVEFLSTIEFEFEVNFYEENSSIELEFSVVQFADSDIHIEYDIDSIDHSYVFII